MEEEPVTKMERRPWWRAPGMNLALPLVLGVVISATLAWFGVVSAGAAVWIGGSIAFIAAVGLTVGFSFLVSFVVPVLGLPALAMVGVRVVFDASVTATATTGVVGLVVALFLFLFSLQLRWVGPLLVRPVLYALAASGLVLGSYVLRNEDVWAAALSCSVLVVGGLVALRFGRVLPGALVCLGAIGMAVPLFWGSLDWTTNAPAWARLLLILLAFPPVRWTISRLDPNRAEVRQSARVRVIGRSESDRSGIWTTLTLTNRAHHEIRNLHVLTHSNRGGPTKCADLLLPGESVTRSIGKWFPSFLEVIFEDWSGTTWVHRRSVIVWAEQYPLRLGTSGYGDNIQCQSEAAVATSKLRMSVRWLGEPLLVLVEHFRLRRGIQQLNVPVADYLERTDDMPRKFSESDTEFI